MTGNNLSFFFLTIISYYINVSKNNALQSNELQINGQQNCTQEWLKSGTRNDAFGLIITDPPPRLKQAGSSEGWTIPHLKVAALSSVLWPKFSKPCKILTVPHGLEYGRSVLQPMNHLPVQCRVIYYSI